MAKFKFTFTQQTICIKIHKKRCLKLSQLLIKHPDPVLRLHICNSLFRNMHDGMMDLNFYLRLMKTDYIALFIKTHRTCTVGNYTSIHPTI